MADNYLERRMEDFRSGKLAVDLRTKAYKSRTKANLKPLTGVRSVVTGGAAGKGLEIVKLLRKNGSSVDIIDTDRKRGHIAAQATGSRFIPADTYDFSELEPLINGVRDHRGAIDVIFHAHESSSDSSIPPYDIYVEENASRDTILNIIHSL